MKCPNCGEEVPSGFLSCFHCGTVLPEEVRKKSDDTKVTEEKSPKEKTAKTSDKQDENKKPAHKKTAEKIAVNKKDAQQKTAEKKSANKKSAVAKSDSKTTVAKKASSKKKPVIPLCIAIVLVLVLVVIALFLSKPKHNGVYTCDIYADFGMEVTLTVKNDTFTLCIKYEDNVESESGKISFDKDVVTLSADGETLVGTYNSKKGTIVIPDLSMTFIKQ